AVLGDGQIYASGDHHFLGMNQSDGQVGHAWIAGYQMTFSGDKALIATGEAIIKVDREAHAKASIERQQLFLKTGSTPANERAKLAAERDRLAKVGIEWATASPLASSIAATSDAVFAGGEGAVAGYRLDDGTKFFDVKVEGEVRGLAISDGVLLVSTTHGDVHAFSTGEAKQPAAPATAAAAPPQDDQTELYAAAAERILKSSDVTRGFCLVVGGEQGRLAWELASRSDLNIYCAEPDAAKVAAARKTLAQAGLYGHRITFVQCPLNALPFSNYFANLIVSDTLVATGKLPVDPAAVARHVKPLGGKICLEAKAQDGAALAATLSHALPKEASHVDVAEGVAMLTRDALPGAGAWSHQYGTAANTSNSQDQLVKGGLGVLWYGDPGPGKMINRHQAAASPLSAGGRLFVQGVDSVMAYDAYNGLFLWERKNPGAIRTGVYNNEDTSDLAATDDALFVCIGDHCEEWDAATGKVRRVHKVPESSDKIARSWGYLAIDNGTLYGSSTLRTDLQRELRRRGLEVANATDAIFAVDLKTGETKWTHRGENIMHMTIAVAEGKVFFIDSSITPEQRSAFLREDKSALEALTGEARDKAEAELKRRDVRRAVALDAAR
ncbi:MAG: hypothetical protein KDA41_01595, partial [Planctomycetales bacterium]|nr:hypothetical protein [Planctomycetales bacterium]